MEGVERGEYFQLQHEYDIGESRAILTAFKGHYPKSAPSKHVKKWPRSLLDQMVDDLEIPLNKWRKLKIIGERHDRSRMRLLREMVERIRADNTEKARQLLLQDYFREKEREDGNKLLKRISRWIRQRGAWRRKQKQQRQQAKKAWISRNFDSYEFDNGEKIYFRKSKIARHRN